MSLQTLRIVALASVLVALIGCAVMWRDSHTPAVQENGPAHDDWVRTKDGWERPVWRIASHQPPLHPGLVAAFMALASLGFLVGTAPSRSSISKPNGPDDASARADAENFLEESVATPPLWTPRLVSFEETTG